MVSFTHHTKGDAHGTHTIRMATHDPDRDRMAWGGLWPGAGCRAPRRPKLGARSSPGGGALAASEPKDGADVGPTVPGESTRRGGGYGFSRSRHQPTRSAALSHTRGSLPAP